MLNIVTNAIDAAEEANEATRAASRPPGTPRRARPGSIVADNGVGIPPEDLETIFQIFASTKGTRGTGLGLPVSQKIVREHGGQIQITSEVGKGTTFTIELPMRRCDGKGTMSEVAFTG